MIVCSVIPVGEGGLYVNNAWMRSDFIVMGFGGILSYCFFMALLRIWHSTVTFLIVLPVV